MAIEEEEDLEGARVGMGESAARASALGGGGGGATKVWPSPKVSFADGRLEVLLAVLLLGGACEVKRN